MRTRSMVSWAAAVCAAVLSVTALGAQPALAAPKPRLPITMITQTAAQTTLQTATFAWEPITGATYTCSLDGAIATACTSQVTYTDLTDGTHTFVLRGRKTGTNRPNTRSISWHIDSIVPGAPVVSAVPSPTSSTSANVSFTNADPTAVSHACSLDGAVEAPCTSPYAVSSLTEGSHTVAVRAVDNVGNKSPAATVSWVVDLTAPANVLASGPTSPTNATTAEVDFSAAGATAYTCALDDAPAVPCTSPWTVPAPVSEGTHTVVVTGSDGAGNSAQPASVVWEVDVTAPWVPTIVTGPPPVTNQTTATFVADDIDSSGALQCRLDDPSGAWVSCPSPISYVVIEGTHVLEVRVHDQAGNS